MDPCDADSMISCSTNLPCRHRISHLLPWLICIHVFSLFLKHLHGIMLWMTHGKKTIEAEPPILNKWPTFSPPSHSCIQSTAARKTSSAIYSRVSSQQPIRPIKIVCRWLDRSSQGMWESRAAGGCHVSVLSFFFFFHRLASGKVSDKGSVSPRRLWGKCVCVQLLHYCSTHCDCVSHSYLIILLGLIDDV